VSADEIIGVLSNAPRCARYDCEDPYTKNLGYIVYFDIPNGYICRDCVFKLFPDNYEFIEKTIMGGFNGTIMIVHKKHDPDNYNKYQKIHTWVPIDAKDKS
jgi:hypothetical protein